MCSAPALYGISRLALWVSDLPAAVGFWTGPMGFEPTTETPTMAFVVQRECGIGLGLCAHGDGDGAVAVAVDEHPTGCDHLAFAVPDRAVLEQWQRRLEEHGVEHTPVVESASGLRLDLRGPDRMPIELYVTSAGSDPD